MPSAVRRHGPLALTVAACALLVVAEFTTLYAIRVDGATVKSATVGAHHGYALLVVALAAVAMAVAAVRGGSRAAARALVALAAFSLVIALVVDLPVVDDTGLYGRDYQRARAQAEIGFRLETAGALLLVLGSATVLLFGTAGAALPRRHERHDAAPADAPT